MTKAYLYKWTELSTNKWYIGSRTKQNCHPNDGYICSSKVVLPLIKNNPDNWVRQVLCIGTPEYIRDLEATYLKQLNASRDSMSYNMHNCDQKFFTKIGKVFTPETRAKISAAKKGVPKSEEHKAKISATLKGKTAPNKGKPMSPEQRVKISQAHKARQLQKK